jgi:hypothetical protein
VTRSLSPDRILGIGFGFFAAKTLMAAVKLNVFGHLAAGPLDRAQLGRALGLSQRGERDFFDTLVALGLLDKRPGRGPDGEDLYQNSDESEVYLVPSSDLYVGGILSMAGERLYKFWHDLPEALVTGCPQSEVKYSGRPLFDEIFKDPVKLRSFAEAMAGLSRQNFEKLATIFPFSDYATHLDVGASTGLLSRLIVSRHPNVLSTAFDLPEVAAITREHVARAGLTNRIQVLEGSFLTDELPKAHVVTLGNILHDWDLVHKKHILAQVKKSVLPGGACLIIENIIDDGRQANIFGLLMSLNMLIEFGDAYDCTFAELEELCREVGFSRFERLHVHGPCSALIAR